MNSLICFSIAQALPYTIAMGSCAIRRLVWLRLTTNGYPPYLLIPWA